MSQPSNTYSRYDQATTVREDLLDFISNIAPTDTPIVTMAGTGTASNTLHEWQTDTLRAPGQNAKIEGDAYSNAARTPPVRVSNYTQIANETIGVTHTARAVNTAGREDDLMYELEKASKAVKRDMEYDITNNQAPSNGTDDSAARTLRPLNGWIATNVDRGASGANGSSSAAATDGTQRVFTEDLLKNVLALGVASGAKFGKIVTGPYNAGVFSSFSGGNNRQQSAEEKKITAVRKVYEGEFGVYEKVFDLFSRERDVWLVDPSMISIDYLRPWEVIDLAKTSATDQKVIECEYTLRVNNEKGLGQVADLTTSA
jgi:uncharacterized protein DUF5309